MYLYLFFVLPLFFVSLFHHLSLCVCMYVYVCMYMYDKYVCYVVYVFIFVFMFFMTSVMYLCNCIYICICFLLTSLFFVSLFVFFSLFCSFLSPFTSWPFTLCLLLARSLAKVGCLSHLSSSFCYCRLFKILLILFVVSFWTGNEVTHTFPHSPSYTYLPSSVCSLPSPLSLPLVPSPSLLLVPYLSRLLSRAL